MRVITCSHAKRHLAETMEQVSNHAGIFVDVVNHFNLVANGVRDTSSATAVRTLEANWESSLRRAETMFDRIMKLTEECRQ